MRTFVLIAAVLAAVPYWAAQTLLEKAPPKAAAKVNPYQGQERARQAGRKLYSRECASCHGESGEGAGSGPPLTAAAKAAPGALYWVLRSGSARGGMPSFSHLPEPQRWQIVTFLQSRAAGR